MKRYFMLLILVGSILIIQAEILIPMDNSQTNHLRAYGVVFRTLKLQQTSKWLLNYRGGSFLCPENQAVINDLHISGVSYEIGRAHV